MMAPSNPTPLVIFALIAMVICGMLGLVVGQDPFGPGREVRAEQARTQLAVEMRGTEMALQALETPQAAFAMHTMEAAQWTAQPARQAAAQAAGLATIEAARIQATQTAIAVDALNRQLILEATGTALSQNGQVQAAAVAGTATAIARSEARQELNGSLGASALGLGVLVLCGWIAARIVVQVLRARAQEKAAQARFLAEQRRMAALRASLRANHGSQAHTRVPTSLMNRTGDTDKLPRAE